MCFHQLYYLQEKIIVPLLWEATGVDFKGAKEQTAVWVHTIWYFSICTVSQTSHSEPKGMHTLTLQIIKDHFKDHITWGSQQHRVPEKMGHQEALESAASHGIFLIWGQTVHWGGARMFSLPPISTRGPYPVPFIQQVFIKGLINVRPSAKY